MNLHRFHATQVSDHLLADWHAYNQAAAISMDTVDRLTPTLGSGPINHTVRCLGCGLTGVELLDNPEEPPDPDRHGNRRSRYRCPNCEETVVLEWGHPSMPPRVSPPTDFELAD